MIFNSVHTRLYAAQLTPPQCSSVRRSQQATLNQPQTASRDAHRRSKMTPCSTAGSTSMVSSIGHLRAGALSSIASASPGARSMFHWGMGGSLLRRRVARRNASHHPPHSGGLTGRAWKGREHSAVTMQPLHCG